MSLLVVEPGLQSTLQDLGRPGWRHLGIPTCGAADPLALTQANYLVDKPAAEVAIEMTLSGASFEFCAPLAFAVTGASGPLYLDDRELQPYATHDAKAGQCLRVGPAERGCRSYLALSGELQADRLFDSGSTYLPARFGGHHGRALRAGDSLVVHDARPCRSRVIEATLQPPLLGSWTARAVAGPEFDQLEQAAQASLFAQPFSIGHRLNRMGAQLQDHELAIRGAGQMASGAVFPGTVQCPPAGAPLLLLADAQTSGGYPRVAQVIRADRHLLGQLRPGDRLRLLQVNAEQAAGALREKLHLLSRFGTIAL